jgi:N-acetylmuramoyl-L-alanine amidase
VTPEAAPLPVVEAGGGGTLRTIVIDPGHGGDDVGTRGPGGTLEKDYVLAFARRLKATIEGRIGLRVLLTRNTDENVPLDRRASLANNNKADLFISLHANGASRPSVRGSQVLSLRLNDYAGRSPDTGATDLPVAFLGGGTRVIDVLPWDLAQIGFTDRSAAAAAILTRHLSEAKVPVFTGPTAELPLRPLVGANMPAIMFELGFLTSPDDERELNGSAHSTKLLEAVLRTIADIRRGALLSAGVDGQ